MNKEPDIQFGSFNVETGESQTGFIDKHGEMKYRCSWLKRLFSKPPRVTEYLTSTEVFRQLIWSSKKTYFQAPVYKTYNPYTGKVYEVFALCDDRKMQFEVAALPNLVMKGS